MVIVRSVLLSFTSLMLCACQSLMATSNTTPSAFPSPSPLPEITSEAAQREWIEQEVKGILLGIEKPAGWEAQRMDDGILLAEHAASIASGGQSIQGIQVHIFVHALQGFDIPTDKNVAWAILDQITHDQKYIGRARVNEPYGFVWSRHDAAFYLSNNGDGNVTMLIGIAMPDTPQMVVCNVTAPVGESHRIRDMLPVILDTLTVNSISLAVEALQDLPAPLQFPMMATPNLP